MLKTLRISLECTMNYHIKLFHKEMTKNMKYNKNKKKKDIHIFYKI